eukprot:TRINITY_DN3467_c0_g1_i1.p1 TRINITY_DN3467_c0_g1~~TRINITY_DN3467_c0_g1_i1.p1  ORF type:complete len:823 (+),score=129.26 TRINITY_DN3467_c0_g1_i1:22-2469(+)
MDNFYVVKNDGRRELFRHRSVTDSLEALCEGLDREYIDPSCIAQKVVEGLKDGMKTSEIETLLAETCASLTSKHPDFSKLAARVAVSSLHKHTSDLFSETCRRLFEHVDEQGRSAALLDRVVYEFIRENAEELDAAIHYQRDFDYDFFGFKTLEKSYLLCAQGKIVERPQHMLMRIACGIHAGDVKKAIETYDLCSRRYFTHASPTLFNAGTPMPQMSSCFLLTMTSDSLQGVFDTLNSCALISHNAGGIGLTVSQMHARGSYTGGSHGYSKGLIPMLRLFNDTARYVDPGGGKRKGAMAIYLEPWHADIFDFLELKRNHGKEEDRARDLFYGLWVPDLFMERVKQDLHWTLFCPDEAYDEDSGKHLYEVWGAAFDDMYQGLEGRGKGRMTIKARQLWFKILESQMETGTPYMLYKDACNRKSNQQNLGTIRCSNLCTEVVQYTSPDEIAVCNLASVALPMFVKVGNPSQSEANACQLFDHKMLHEVTKVVTRNLNKIIDRNFYPVEKARTSNTRHRPIGIGVQGLADTFIKLRLPFESQAARRLNEDIFETIYFAACEASMELAEAEGPYETFAGSPASQGQLQFDLWGVKPKSGRWDWSGLKAKIQSHGLRNSLLVAPMPTASTAQILGNNESIEPYTQNMYVRRVLSGEFVQVNRHLLNDLIERKLWNEELRQKLIAHDGSVQHIEEVPDDLKSLYKTVWEIKQRAVLDMAADRSPYIDQSQSLNIHMANASTAKLTSMHFHGWHKGLKTGMYYLRTKAAADAIKVTVDVATAKLGSARSAVRAKADRASCESQKPFQDSMHSRYECLSCGS